MSAADQPETVLDVGAEQLGKVYARALLGACAADGSALQLIHELGQICEQALAVCPALVAAFESPRVSAAEKIRVIDRLFGTSVHPTLVKFMKVMAGRGRLGYLAAVHRSAVKLFDEDSGQAVAHIRTAVPLTDVLRGDVATRLSARLGKAVRLRESVDPSLIGGMIIRVGDTVFDSSVSGRLEKIGRAASSGFARKMIESSDRFSASS